MTSPSMVQEPSAIAIDGIAESSLRAKAHEHAGALECDACGEPIEGEAAGSGLYVWVRDGELRLEEPPLCMRCATAIGVTALGAMRFEDDEEG